MKTGRRTLQFQSLDDIMPDVERLIGHNETVGEWSLAQICHHIATVMRRVVDLPASTPQDPSQWVGEERKREVFETGSIPEGLPAPAEIIPTGAFDERDEAEGLRKAIAYYKASAGPVIPHRLFGFLTKAEWDRLQCVHAAHHLSFVKAKPR